MHVVYLGLGSNLGERERYVAEAIARIGERVGQVVRQSSLYVTEPWGFRSVHPFVNAVVCCQTTLTPRQLLCATQQIERELGRRHKSHDGAYEDRTIDIDILRNILKNQWFALRQLYQSVKPPTSQIERVRFQALQLE